MQFLAAINKVLDIKAVQWGLLGLAILTNILLGVQSTRLWTRGVMLQSAKADAADSKAFLAVQNAAVLDLKAKGEEVTARVESAKAESLKIAADYERRIQQLKKQPIREDCCGAIEDAKNMVLGVIP